MYQIAGIIPLLLLCLLLYQTLATQLDDLRYPPPGKLVDIGGYRLHLYCSGAGGPSVVFDAGLSGTSLGWSLVQDEVSTFTLACSFDRAGYSWSDKSPLRRTSLNLATELYTLLKQAEIKPPYLLVGHSFGGCNALLFAHMYPEETFGVVLVDSVHEDMLEAYSHESQSLLQKIFNHPYYRWLETLVGYKRLKGPSEEIMDMFAPLPEGVKKSYIAQMNKTKYSVIVSEEMTSLPESLGQMRKIDLRGIPLAVISAGKFSGEHEKRVWDALQKKHLSKSSRSKHIIAESSDHMINHHQPSLIAKVIRDMIAGNM